MRPVTMGPPAGPALDSTGMAKPSTPGVRLAELVASLSLATDLGLGQPQEHVLRQTVIATRLASVAGLTRRREGRGVLRIAAGVGRAASPTPMSCRDGSRTTPACVRRATRWTGPDADDAIPPRAPRGERIGRGARLDGGPFPDRRSPRRHEVDEHSLRDNRARSPIGSASRRRSGARCRRRWSDGTARAARPGSPASGSSASCAWSRSRTKRRSSFASEALRRRRHAQRAQRHASSTPGWSTCAARTPRRSSVASTPSTPGASSSRAARRWTASWTTRSCGRRSRPSPTTPTSSRPGSWGIRVPSPRSPRRQRAAPDFRLPRWSSSSEPASSAGSARSACRQGPGTRPGPLSRIEWERVRTVPYLTERVLTHQPRLAEVGTIAGMVHERIDGSGYPRGLSGGAIPPAARVLAAAEVYQASARGTAAPCRAVAERAPGPAAPRGRRRAAGRSGGRRRPGRGRASDPATTAHGRRPDRARDRGPRAPGRAACPTSRSPPPCRSRPRTVGSHIEHIYTKIGVSTAWLGGDVRHAPRHRRRHPIERRGARDHRVNDGCGADPLRSTPRSEHLGRIDRSNDFRWGERNVLLQAQ